MPKIKTHKATAKRYRLTGTSKLMQRKTGQDHFNAGETGATKRQKRRDIATTKVFDKTIRALMPYKK
jgi:large subunit ribosomal protein L35